MGTIGRVHMSDLPLNPADLTWLASLAHALVQDPGAADDLAQDTVLATLTATHPPRGSKRAWMAGIARRLDLKNRRSAVRRARREQVNARSEVLPGAHELASKAELAEQVSKAVQRLAEPYRRTILLHFLEGHSPEEVARLDGDRVDTVRWRIRRGLTLLRAELAHKTGLNDRALGAWLLPLAKSTQAAGNAALVSLSPTWTGAALGVLMKSWIMIGAALIAAGAWWASSPSPEMQTAGLRPDHERSRSNVPLNPPKTATEALAQPTDKPASGLRVAAPAQIEATERVSAPTRPIWRGQVIDPDSQGIGGARIFLQEPAPDGGPSPKSTQQFLAQTKTEKTGHFELRAPLDYPSDGRTQLDLIVLANGFHGLRQSTDLASAGERDWLLQVDPGLNLRVRVEDEYGKGIRDLELMAHSPGRGIDHVSQTRTLLRAERVQLDATQGSYYQCIGRTDSLGMLTLNGLSHSEVQLRSLDPGWTLVGPNTTSPGGGLMVLTAARRFGVRVKVRYPGPALEQTKIGAKFRVTLVYGDGGQAEFGQWIGGGSDEVRFTMQPNFVPAGALDKVATATFFGTITCGVLELPWRAETLTEGGTAEAFIDLNEEQLRVALGQNDALQGPQIECSDQDLLLDVRFDDGSPCNERLSVSWVSSGRDGTRLRDTAEVSPMSPGRYALQAAAGDLKLSVAEWGSSGSQAPWASLVQEKERPHGAVSVTLRRGGRVALVRPIGGEGAWDVRASWREATADAWQGNWGYGTDEERLELNSMRMGWWRMVLTPENGLEKDLVVRTFRLRHAASLTIAADGELLQGLSKFGADTASTVADD